MNRITVKNTACPLCSDLLVVEDGRITCANDCELLKRVDDWHPDTMALVQPAIDYQKEQAAA